jgi:hypothetical protein
MPDLIRHPVPSWIPDFIRLWRIRRNDGFGVFSCRSNNPVALDLLNWLIAGHSLLYNNWVLYLNLNYAILIPGPPDRHSGEPRIKVRGQAPEFRITTQPTGFRLSRLCRNEKNLSFRTSDAVHREIRKPELQYNSKNFWIPARAPLNGLGRDDEF